MSREPQWLSIDVLLALHEELVAEHGGLAAIRDMGLLESAMAGPRNRHAHDERDFFSLATTYAAGITRNHPFVDGNKRVAFMAVYTFLGINGIELQAPETEVVGMVLGLSDRTVSEPTFTEWLRVSCRRCIGTARRKASNRGRPGRRKK